MSNLLVRLILSMLLIPLTVIGYFLCIFASSAVTSESDELRALFTDLAMGTFVATSWLLIWRRVVRWTPRRRLWTTLSGLICIGSAVVVSYAVCFLMPFPPRVAWEFVLVLTFALAAPLWLVATTLLWRETAVERVARLKGIGRTVACLRCGYNLTGLREARCPECGTQYTLDELLAGQVQDTVEPTAASEQPAIL